MKYLSLLLIGLLFISSCRDDDFDGPDTTFENPDISANTTIADLKAGNILGEFDEITDDVIISGIVTADDESGNFFREIIIQDETGPISIALDANDVYNLYPIGRRIFVKCQGLWIGDNRGSQQLGAGQEIDGNFVNVLRIPDALITQYIFPGALEGQPEPEAKKLNELTTNDFNKLIRLTDVEIAPALVGLPYANAGAGSGVNQTVVDCNGSQVTMRNSDFASFAAEEMPSGNGDIICIYSVFGSDPQIKIRDTDDMILQNASCNVALDCDEISVAALQDCFSGSETALEPGTITGIVISDRQENATNFQNVVLQDGTRGIVVRFTEGHSFDLGDKLEIGTAGTLLSEFNGLVQVSEVPLSVASKISSGNIITPLELTTQQVISNGRDLESTLIQINDVSFSGSTWSGESTISDATGLITHYGASGANFADNDLPNTADAVIAIVSTFNGSTQCYIRKLSDVISPDGSGNPGGNEVEVSIQSIRDLWTGPGSETSITGAKKIIGVVTSDFANGNINAQNVVLQNADAGIVVRFTEAHGFSLGQNVEVIVTGQSVSDFNELVQINNVPLSNAKVVSNGLTVTPVLVSISDVTSNPDAFESRLVKFEDVTISGAGTFNGNNDLSDGTGTIGMWTFSGASFSDNNTPSGAVNVTAIVSDFNGVQVNIRSQTDIE